MSMAKVVSWFIVALCPIPACATVPAYELVPLGLLDSEHTRADGYRLSIQRNLNAAGQATGLSERFDNGGSRTGRSAWLYDGIATRNVGLTDFEHTSVAGGRNSAPYSLNKFGQVIGTASRYIGGGEYMGTSAWIFDGSATRAIGLRGPEFTRASGYRDGAALSMNDAGHVIGHSVRFMAGSNQMGRSAWFYDGIASHEIGLTGASYIQTGGSQYSDALYLNLAGQVSGYSYRYGGVASLGQEAWLYQRGVTSPIGPADREHTRHDGYRLVEPRQLTAAGNVVGYAARYNGSNIDLGQSVWHYDGKDTINIGLVDSEHTRSNGYRHSMIRFVNDAGQVVGSSASSAVGWGQSSWIFDGAKTTKIGLYNAGQMGIDRFKGSEPTELNAAGQVCGVSVRYNSTNNNEGSSSWLYDGTRTIEIGPDGSGYRLPNGHKHSTPIDLNASGQVTGSAHYFDDAGESLGIRTWLYDGDTTIDLGLTDAEYVYGDGYRSSLPLKLNDLGQVAGISFRFDESGTNLGHDAWLYDSSLRQTFSIQLSTRSDGYAFSEIDYLGQNGLALGRYKRFDASDNDLGEHLFYFSVSDGLHDLGALVDGGLAAFGWERLAEVADVNQAGQIVGLGYPLHPSEGMAYILTPQVPEPATVALSLTGLVVMCAALRRPRGPGRGPALDASRPIS